MQLSERKVATSERCVYLKGVGILFANKKQKCLPNDGSAHPSFVQVNCSESERGKLPFILMKTYDVVSHTYPECR